MPSGSETDLRGLSGLDDERLAEIFRQRGNDPRCLDALNAELKHRQGDTALDLHFQVAKARRALGHLAVGQSDQTSDWLRSFLAKRRLLRPDERPLYRYRMADGEYENAKIILRRLTAAGRLIKPNINIGALFVAYCAEWFRRESTSTFLRWDDPAPDLFPSVPYASKQALTNYGLRYWRRQLRRSEYARKFLLTVALEGGFPVRILAEGARGWLKEYLRAIMRRAIAWRVDAPDRNSCDRRGRARADAKELPAR